MTLPSPPHALRTLCAGPQLRFVQLEQLGGERPPGCATRLQHLHSCSEPGYNHGDCEMAPETSITIQRGTALILQLRERQPRRSGSAAGAAAAAMGGGPEVIDLTESPPAQAAPTRKRKAGGGAQGPAEPSAGSQRRRTGVRAWSASGRLVQLLAAPGRVA